MVEIYLDLLMKLSFLLSVSWSFSAFYIYEVGKFHRRLSDLLKVTMPIYRKIILRILTVSIKEKTLSRTLLPFQ